MEVELLQWFGDSRPIQATDNRRRERRERSGEPVKSGVTPLEPPEFRGGGSAGGR